VLVKHSDFEIDDSLERVDFDLVHSWLSTSYWSPGVDRDKVERAAHGSATVIGAYAAGRQVGYARVVSDKVTFAWLADVFVDPSFRGRGVARAMVKFAMELPYSPELRRWVLATRDAHSIYSEYGFVPIDNPENWMCRRAAPQPL
jgi:GNAT superfamily N-acetyltransferase